MAATIIYLVSRLLLTPFVLNYLTLAEFGLWSMCFVVLSYISMGAFGVNNTYIRYTARFRAEKRDIEISKLLSTGITGMLIFCAVFFIALYLFMPLILRSFNVGEDMASTATIMILGTTAIFSLDLTLGGFRSVVEGLQEIALVKKIYTAAALVEIAAIVIFISQGSGVVGMLYAYIVRIVLDTGICIVFARKLIPTLRFSLKLINREHIRVLFIFGGKVQVLGAIAIFLSAFDRMVISAVIGLSAAGMFEVGRKFPFTSKSVSGAAIAPFLPAAADLEGSLVQDSPPSIMDRSGSYFRIVMLALCTALIPMGWASEARIAWPSLPWITALIAGGSAVFFLLKLKNNFAGNDRIAEDISGRLYIGGIRHINLINVTLFAFLAAVARPLITAWVGEGYGDAVLVTVFLAVGYMVQQSTGPVTLIFRGINRCGRELEYQLIQLVLALIWIPAGTIMFGLKGTAGAIAVTAVVAAGFLFWRSNYTFRVSFKEYAHQTLVPLIIPLTIAVGIHTLTLLIPFQNRGTAALQVVLYGVLYMILLVPLTWKLVLTSEEKGHALDLIPFFKRGGETC